MEYLCIEFTESKKGNQKKRKKAGETINITSSWKIREGKRHDGRLTQSLWNERKERLNLKQGREENGDLLYVCQGKYGHRHRRKLYVPSEFMELKERKRTEFNKENGVLFSGRQII